MTEHELQRQKRNAMKRKARMVLARKLGTHTKDQWLALCAEFGQRCVKCGRTECHLDKDHIIPVYQGGSDGLENIQPLCAWCNAKKGPDGFNWKEFRRINGFETGGNS